jgi:hypothetical protein
MARFLECSCAYRNSVRSENTGVPTIREIMVTTTMSSLFVALCALVGHNYGLFMNIDSRCRTSASSWPGAESVLRLL